MNLEEAAHSLHRMMMALEGMDAASGPMSFVAKQAGFDSESDKYLAQLDDLTYEALERRISFDKFMERVTVLITASYLLALLFGSRMSQADLTMDEYMLLAGYTATAIASAKNLAEEIYRGEYDDEGGRERLKNRLDKWGNALFAVYNFGHLLDKSNPFLKWLWAPEKDHCGDCIRLNGQVHKASEWKASGWHPQSHDLECHGYRCGCRWIRTGGPSVGAF